MKSHLVISLTKPKYRKSFNLDLWILNPILSRSNGQTIKRGSQSKPTGNHPHEGRDNHAMAPTGHYRNPAADPETTII